MNYSRRDFGKLALASLPAAALLSKSGSLFAAAQTAGKPNSIYHGVQIGVITGTLPQHAGSERGSDSSICCRLRDQCD